MDQTLAIIGASAGQRPVYEKARELGFRTIGFAWEKGAVCKDLADCFYPISVFETDRIVDICRKEGVSGVVSNGSDFTAEAVSAVASRLGLPCVPYQSFLMIKDKYAVRQVTDDIEGLYSPWFYKYEGQDPPSFPCVVKPCTGCAKLGVSYADDLPGFHAAIRYANDHSNGKVLVEEFVPGRELSVESISFRGAHDIVQVTDRKLTGPPHFQELEFHQPSTVTQEEKNRLVGIVRQILTRIHFDNGASHMEMKITEDGRIFLIEVNPRGSGSETASRLVPLSTGFDYIASMIQVAVGQYEPVEIKNVAYSGLYFLCGQTRHLLPFFSEADGKPWLVAKVMADHELRDATTNYDLVNYLVYVSDHKVLTTE